jgi:catechol 2,3-dioxygenase-like lactoylglutathione lyase family enzyme
MGAGLLDHVALWVEDRDSIAEFATSHLGMHVIERTERFTLVGSDARRGKLTLFVAEGPRERGPLKHVALRVSDLDGALAELPDGLAVERQDGAAYFDVSEGLRLGLVQGDPAVEYDLDHVALFSADPGGTSDAYLPLGFEPAGGVVPRVEARGAFVEFHEGNPGDPERPLLNHLAILVDSADEWKATAEELGVEVADVVDAPNTYAVFVWAPEHVKLEYVEHKPSFSLT